jgi:O-antigen/teichoic acid export membrane protein
MTVPSTTPNAEAPAIAGALPQWRALLGRYGADFGPARADALAAFGIRVVSAGLLYLSQVLFARWMGSFEFGLYVTVWTWVLVLGGLSHLGFAMASVRLMATYAETGDDQLARGLVTGGRVTALGVATVIALAGLAGLNLFGDLLSRPAILPAYLALVCLPMFALTDLQDGIGRGRGWVVAALMPPYVLRPAVLLAVMAAARAGGWPMTAATAIGAAVVATWLAAAVQTIAVERRLRRAYAAGTGRTFAFRTWFGIAWPLLAIYAAELVVQNADIVVLSAQRSPVEVGMYFAAAKTMALVMFIHYAIGSAAAHRFAALKARGDTAALAAFVGATVRWTFWPSVVAIVGLLAAGRPLLWLFSAEFTAAYPVMFVLAAGFVVRASVGPVEALLNMLGEQRACAAVLAAAAALHVGASMVMVPRLGILGAAVAATLAMVASAVAMYRLARRRLGLDVFIVQNLR